jgi:hypothetical protein
MLSSNRKIIISAWAKRQDPEPIESLSWIFHASIVLRWDWYFKYRAALMQVKYPKAHITFSINMYEEDSRSKLQQALAEEIKRRTQITRIKNRFSAAVKQWRQNDPLGLTPIEEHPNYDMFQDRLLHMEDDYQSLLERIEHLKRESR